MSTKTRREREKLERKADILTAARNLFWQGGFDKTTMPMIAKAVELATGTLYLYFPSKESIYVELLCEGYELLIEKLDSAIDRGLAPREQAARFIDIFMDFAKQEPNYFEILFFVVQREGKGVLDIRLTDEQRKKLKRYQKAVMKSAHELIRAGQGVDDEAAIDRVSAIWSMLAGVVIYYLKDGEEVFSRVKAAAEQIILAGLFDNRILAG